MTDNHEHDALEGWRDVRATETVTASVRAVFSVSVLCQQQQRATAAARISTSLEESATRISMTILALAREDFAIRWVIRFY